MEMHGEQLTEGRGGGGGGGNSELRTGGPALLSEADSEPARLSGRRQRLLRITA